MVSLDLDTRRRFYNRCDPDESLDPQDDRNVDIDAAGAEGERVRGVHWVDRLADRLLLAGRPQLFLFTGLPGSGKSTELRRLVARLGDGAGFNLLPVLVNAEETIDLTSPVDVVEIVAAILEGVEEEVLRVEGKDPKDTLRDGYATRLWNWLSKTDLELGKGELAIPKGAKLVAELKTRPTLRERVRRAVAARLTTFLADAHAELLRLQERARERGRGGVVVVFDSLEKLRGISTNWHDVLASAEQLFAAGAPYLKLPVHAIYTIPPALVTRRTDPIQFMPMIKLRGRDGAEFAPGFAVARELVRRRVPDDGIQALLGPAHEERLKTLIAATGGYPREIVRLLREVVATPDLPATDSDFRRILNEIRDGYHQVVPASAFEWLARVALDKSLTIQDEDHRRSADLMLSNNAVLRYCNEEMWYDLHPAVEQIPGVRQAIERLRGMSGNGAA